MEISKNTTFRRFWVGGKIGLWCYSCERVWNEKKLYTSDTEGNVTDKNHHGDFPYQFLSRKQQRHIKDIARMDCRQAFQSFPMKSPGTLQGLEIITIIAKTISV